MSADRLFCWHQQRVAVVEFLRHLGAPISARSPQAIHEPAELRGLSHITFIDVRDHDHPVPPAVWAVLKERGAIVVEMDDHLVREQRLHVHHHKGERHARTGE